jgi:hypothetical protein
MNVLDEVEDFLRSIDTPTHPESVREPEGKRSSGKASV